MSEEILGKVAVVELSRKKCIVRYDGSMITTSNGKNGVHDVSL